LQIRLEKLALVEQTAEAAIDTREFNTGIISSGLMGLRNIACGHAGAGVGRMESEAD